MILPALDRSAAPGVVQPGRVLADVHRVLAHAGDPRADDVARRAAAFLRAQSERIRDDDLRARFLAAPGEPAARGRWRTDPSTEGLVSVATLRPQKQERPATGAMTTRGRRWTSSRGRCGTATGPPTIASLWAEVSGRELADQGLEWPPDVFALVGTVLGRTHAYRFAVSPPAGRHWPPAGAAPGTAPSAAPPSAGAAWAEAPEGAAAAAGGRRLGGAAGGGVGDAGGHRRRAGLAGLRGAADRCSPPATRPAPASPPRSTRCGTSGYRFRARADELLARTGSLSRLPTHRLRVLPKVRTPPGGISFRSLSRYLCLRGAVVDVAWHKVPARRSGLGQQQANVLLMPWPLRVRQRDFRPLSGSVRRAENEPFGIFEFAPTEPFDLDLVERTLRGALDEVDGVDAVIFPESACRSTTSQPLEALLARYGVTVLLAGARETTASRRPAARRTGCTWACTWAAAGRTTGRTSTTAGSSTRARSTSTTWPARCTRRCAGGRRWRCRAGRCSSSSSARG